MSISKRLLALAAAGATALVMGGALSVSHTASPVEAAGPSFGAVGCNNGTILTGNVAIGTGSTNQAFGTGVVFPVTAGTGILTGGTQVSTGLPFGTTLGGVNSFNAGLSITNPGGVVECGALFQDATTPNPIGVQDSDPNTIDGGTITYTLSGGSSFAQILESGTSVYPVNCGDAQPPAANGNLATANTRQVQSIAFTGGAGGQFQLHFNGQATGDIDLGSSAATVQQDINSLSTIQALGNGGVTVTGSGTTADPYIVTFNTAGPQSLISIDTFSVSPTAAGVAAVTIVQTAPGTATVPGATLLATTQNFVAGIAATAGTAPVAGVNQVNSFRVTNPTLISSIVIDMQTINFGAGATAASVQAAINAILGAGSVTVSGLGTLASPFIVTFTTAGPRTVVAGANTTVSTTTAGVTATPGTPPTAAVPATPKVITLTIQAVGGTYSLTVNGFPGFGVGTDLPFNATAAQIQAQLTAAGFGFITVGGTFPNFTLTGPLTGFSNQTNFTVSQGDENLVGVPGTDAAFTVVVSGATGGVFTLSLGNLTTGNLAFNATAAQVQAALNAAFNAALGANSVTVTGLGTAASPFVVTFNAVGPRALLTRDITFLTGGTAGVPTAVTSITTAGTLIGGGSISVLQRGGLESCQGAVSDANGARPYSGNVIHVGFRAGATFGIFGNTNVINPGAGAITLTATYNRFPALNVPGAVGPSSLSVSTVIDVLTPVYSMTLTPTAATISAASSGSGTTITAALFRNVTGVLIPLGTTGFSLTNAGLGGVTSVAGAEPGIVTFTTTQGFFTQNGSVSTGGGQVVSVACGPIGGSTPSLVIPTNLTTPFFASSACLTATATLFGGGSTGTAIVTADFIGSVTGARAFAQTSVVLSPASPTVNLSRGCNEVITSANTAVGATPASIVALVQGTTVVSIFKFDNNLKMFVAGFFNTPGAPTDFGSFGPSQSIFICVTGSGTFPTGAF